MRNLNFLRTKKNAWYIENFLSAKSWCDICLECMSTKLLSISILVIFFVLQIFLMQDKSDRVPENRHRFVDSRQAHICPYCRLILKTRYTLQKHIRHNVKMIESHKMFASVCFRLLTPIPYFDVTFV